MTRPEAALDALLDEAFVAMRAEDETVAAERHEETLERVIETLGSLDASESDPLVDAFLELRAVSSDDEATSDDGAATLLRIQRTLASEPARDRRRMRAWAAAAVVLMMLGLGAPSAWAWASAVLNAPSPEAAEPESVQQPEPDPDSQPDPELDPVLEPEPDPVSDPEPQGVRVEVAAEPQPTPESPLEETLELPPSDAEERHAFERAHEAHFRDHDPIAALAAWDDYIAQYPDGRFVLEARYNRALSLVRLGRAAQAQRALAPFADGRMGGYRQEEAQRLSHALDPLRGPRQKP